VNADVPLRRPGCEAGRENVDGCGNAGGKRRRVFFRRGSRERAGRLGETLPRLALLKTGRSLDAGACAIEIDGSEIEMVFVESGFEARHLGTEPPRDLAVGVNRDAHLALLDDGMNLNRAEGVGAYADVHLGVHLRIGSGAGRDRSGRQRKGSGRRRVQHLVSLGKRG